MASRKRKPREEQAAKAAKAFERFHWGDEPTETIAARAPRVTSDDILYQLGELVEVVYTTHKGGRTYDFVHEFSEEDPPILAATIDGRLVIVGGGYKVTARGIVG